jgi:hypothetical protein
MFGQKTKTSPCPTCGGTGTNLRNPNAPCANCQGSGQVSNYFDFPFHYPFNLTVTAPGLPAAFVPPVASVPGSPGNPNQTGVNPALLKLGNENPFEWIFNVVKVTSPYVDGDASDFLQLLMTDVSATTWPFMNAPIVASLFAGDAKNPFPQLNPLTFGKQTQLSVTGYPILISGLAAALGVGDGAAVDFTANLVGPVLPGSVSILDNGAVVATDADGDGILTGAGGSGTVIYDNKNAAIAFSFTVAPVAGHKITASYTQGCAVINAQLSLEGNYRRQISSGEQIQQAQR